MSRHFKLFSILHIHLCINTFDDRLKKPFIKLNNHKDLSRVEKILLAYVYRVTGNAAISTYYMRTKTMRFSVY